MLIRTNSFLKIAIDFEQWIFSISKSSLMLLILIMLFWSDVAATWPGFRQDLIFLRNLQQLSSPSSATAHRILASDSSSSQKKMKSTAIYSRDKLDPANSNVYQDSVAKRFENNQQAATRQKQFLEKNGNNQNKNDDSYDADDEFNGDSLIHNRNDQSLINANKLDKKNETIPRNSNVYVPIVNGKKHRKNSHHQRASMPSSTTSKQDVAALQGNNFSKNRQQNIDGITSKRFGQNYQTKFDDDDDEDQEEEDDDDDRKGRKYSQNNRFVKKDDFQRSKSNLDSSRDNFFNDNTPRNHYSSSSTRKQPNLLKTMTSPLEDKDFEEIFKLDDFKEFFNPSDFRI
ncbi:hypothetical protein SSS_06573 [Sarcoptes scabiei]|uniref:Uncharacterized protein n=1 Tax=Sarcoptes scabiei TaxID=52283 RepID=A0A834RAY6_SARSC|nr:hypothetical protein SSS_06573 [Sarcoptes scabiei]